LSKPGNTGIARVIAATRYSLSGLRAAWRFESAFRQETTLAVFLMPVALWLGTTAVERALLIAVLGIVLITELLNSAVEAVVDRVGEEHHALAGRAKDMGSAAVFISLVLALVTWGVIAYGRFA
jgi:diacylglycerol kinase (ATP)